MYSKEVMDYFTNPKNMGEIENADGTGKVGNFICGDITYVYIKVAQNQDNEDIISDIKFKCLGCAAAIASSSKVTELAKGKSLKEAMTISKMDIAKSFNFPPNKIHCSILADDALKEAIYDYLTKNNKKIPEELEKLHLRIKKELEAAEAKSK